ncbi:hypothetical protein BHQ17_21565 [Mycolicibacterium holsaticum]|uniref:Uncharacterized protein n=1 Tax=Mycolicibacterium holsaticum TaxID=152142 RepID=A0A1E3R8A3_9MYCO|nr:hypothetical protein BHQ17_21565 [Mycolicibacterium holsaticum]
MTAGTTKGPIDRRGQVDEMLTERCEGCGVADVYARRRRVEHDVDVVEYVQRQKAVDALVRRLHLQAAGPREPVGAGIDAHHRGQFECCRQPEDLDHQVGADISEPMIAAFFTVTVPADRRSGRKPGRAW